MTDQTTVHPWTGEISLMTTFSSPSFQGPPQRCLGTCWAARGTTSTPGTATASIPTAALSMVRSFIDYLNMLPTNYISGWVHQGHWPTPAVKNFYLLKNILNHYRNYVIKYFYPKLSHSLIYIKIPYFKIPNNAPSLPAKNLTLLCFEVEQIWDHFCTTGGICIVKMFSDLLHLKA